MIRFSEKTPTISQVYQYTYLHSHTKSRFENMDRDILPSRIKISTRQIYKKNKEGKYSTPEERIIVSSWSAPQYYPYSRYKSEKAKRQLKIKHNYDVILCIQLTPEKTYSFWNSKIVWRVGSLNKYPKTVPQNKVKSIFKETRNRLNKKYRKLSEKERQIAIKKDIEKIRKNAPYIDVGDYASQELGINGDNYFRDYPLQMRFDCLYGKCYYQEKPQDIDFPFFCKHMLGVIHFLLAKGILKYN